MLMKKYLLCTLCACAITGCADLAVQQTQVVWTDDLKVVATSIKNIGTKSSPATLVYFDGEENPVSDNDRPQVRQDLSPLSPGAAETHLADFVPLARPGNRYLSNVHGITVTADPKHTVREYNRGNNISRQALSSTAYSCVNFNSLAAGTVFGAPAGQSPGVTVMAQAGVQVTGEYFRFAGTGGTFHSGRVEAAGSGAGNVVRLNNINLDFDLSGVSPPPRQVVLRFRDLGGYENLSVNGAPSPIYVGELTSSPSPLGVVLVHSVATPIPGGKVGTVALIDLTGPIQHVRIGGQEFWLNALCYR
jgi:CARDB